MTALASRAVRPRTVPVRVLAGAGTAVVALALCAAGCVLLVRNVSVGAPSEEGLGYWLMLVVGAVAYAVVGGWLVVRRAAGKLGPLFLFVALSQATTLFTREYGIHGLQVGDRLPGDRWVFWTSTWTWVPGVLSVVLLLPLLMPDGAAFSRRWRLAVVCTAVTIAFATLGWAVTPYDQFDGPALDAAIGANPVVIPVAAAMVIDVVGPALLLVSAVLAIAALVVRWRHTDADRRRAMAWVLYGVALSITCEVAAVLVDVPALAALSIVALPLCCLVAVTRHRLWDLQLVVRRSLLYGGLTAVVATAYAGAVGLVGGAVGAGSGAPIVATAIVAMLVLPLHHVLRRVVNRIVYGLAEDPYVTTTRLGRRLGSAIAADQLVTVVLPEILDGVRRALSLRHLSVVMADGRAFAHGADAPDPVELPLRHAGQLVGTLRAVPAHGGLTRSEYRALEDVAAQAAVAVHGVLLAGELQRERERVVVAREEERRRLRRELHDGVGTAIAAASLTAEAARDLMVDHPDQGLALLTRLGDQLRDAVLDVRAVTRDLRPAMLDELGLAGALRELGARSATGDRPVEVEVGALGEVPAAVEVAAYLVVAELVSNASRHSRASRVRVDVHRDDAELSLRVSDDGRGIAPDAVAGVGLGSVRRRVEELGGHVGPFTGPGTSITARLPLATR